MSEKHVEIASKMYSARKSLRYLCPDVFVDRCREWQDVIKKVAEGKGLSDLEAVIHLLQCMKGKEVTQIWIMAAYVEMVEPSHAN